MYEELEYEFADFKHSFDEGSLVFGRWFDEDEYEDDEYDEYDDEAIEMNDYEAAMYSYPESVGATFDRGTFKYVYPKNALVIEEWMKHKRNIRPYRIGAGEVAFYQLVLELNDVAKSFLVVDDFINDTAFYTLYKNI